MAWASAGSGVMVPFPRIFIHGTNIVDRGLKCYFLLFFDLFSVTLPQEEA